MRIKTFQGATMSEAMKAVKAEMGSDAVILEVKEVKKRNRLFRPPFPSVVEVIAANDLTRIEESLLLPPRVASSEQRTYVAVGNSESLPPHPIPLPVGEGDRRSGEAIPVPPTKSPPAIPLPLGEGWGEGKQKSLPKTEAVSSLERSEILLSRPTGVTTPAGVTLPAEVGYMLHPSGGAVEAASFQHFMALYAKSAQPDEVMVDLTPHPAFGHPLPLGEGWGEGKQTSLHPKPLFSAERLNALLPRPSEAGCSLPSVGGDLLQSAYDKMLAGGLDGDTASHLLNLVKKKCGEDPITEDLLTGYLQNIIREWIARFAKPMPVSGPEKIVAIIGPTGVGKTTTLAKIAARLYQEKKKVTLATMDTYRVGAVEQLRTYAEILGIRLRVISSAAALHAFWEHREEGEFLLVDTAGRSPYHDAQLKQLTLLTQVPVEIHLALSAGTRETDLNETIQRFSVVPIDRLLFTKMDETKRRGHLFSVIRKGGIRPSYFTTGQRVPEDMEEATPARIAEEALSSY